MEATPHFSGRVAVVRDRLLDRMAARWVSPAVVVIAPAGCGKTTLLRQAISARPSSGIDIYLRCTPRSAEDVLVELGPCEAMVNPAGVWHTADVHEPVRFLTITPGLGTEHRPC